MLREFQLEHAVHGQAGLGLELLTIEELANRQERYAPDIIEFDACLGFNDSQTNSSFSVIAVVGGLISPPGPSERTIKQAREAWEVFSPLAKLAGAFVPPRIRKAMPIDRIAAGVLVVLIPPPLEDPLGRVMLFAGRLLIVFEKLVNDRQKRFQRQLSIRSLLPITSCVVATTMSFTPR